MSSKEALQSKDPEQVKKARKAVKAQVTNYKNQLANYLKIDTGQADWDHKSLSKNTAAELRRKLDENYKLLDDLHELYTSLK